jgi:hypothetical protein
MATTDSPAHADSSAIRLTGYPSSDSEQESEPQPTPQPTPQPKKRSREGGQRQDNKQYKSAEFVDSESDSSNSPTKLRSTHTSASNETITPTSPDKMRIDNYSWGASASQPSRTSSKRPLPSPTRPAEAKRVRRGPFGGESDSESDSNDDDSVGEAGSPRVTAGEVRSGSPFSTPARPAAAVPTGKKFNLDLFRQKVALKQKRQAGNTGQSQPQVDAKDARLTPAGTASARTTPARTTPARTTPVGTRPVETSKTPSSEYSDIRQRGSSSVSASTSASTLSTGTPHAPVWDPQQMSAPKVFSRKVPAEETSTQTPSAKTPPVQEQSAPKAPVRRTPAHRTSALRPSAQAPLVPLKKPMKKPHEPSKIHSELIRKPEEPAKTETSTTAKLAESPKTAAPVEPLKIDEPVEPPKRSSAVVQPPRTSQVPHSQVSTPALVARKSEIEPLRRSSTVAQPPSTSQAPPSQVLTPALTAKESEAIAVQSEQDTVQPDQDIEQPDQNMEQPELSFKQREQNIVVQRPTPQVPDIPEAGTVQPEQDIAQPEQDVAQHLHDVAVAKPQQIIVQPEDAITLPTPLLTPTASPFFEYTLHTSFSTPSHSTTFEHPTHPLTSAHATASSEAHFSHQTQLLSALGMQSTSSRTGTDQHGLTRHEAVFKNPYDPSRSTTLTFSVSRATVGPLANASADTTSFSPVISCEIYALRLWTLLDIAPESDDEPDKEDVAAESKVRVYCPLPPVCTELHTTLDAANRAAKRVQFYLSHAQETEKERDIEKQWRAKNLAVLNQKVEDLRKEVEGDGGGEGGEGGRLRLEGGGREGTGKGEAVVEEGGRRRGCWFSRFAGTELEEYELRVEPVGVSGPRNL